MVVMGHIAGPFGVLGWVRVTPYTEHPDGLLDYPVWWLGKDGPPWREARVARCEVRGSMLTVALEGCTDRAVAAQLQGLQIAVPRNSLPDLAKNGREGYYWVDLIGLEVINLQAEELGKVTGLLETGANDVLRVCNPVEGDKERLIPFVDAVVAGVDLEKGRITVDWGVDY